MAGREWRVTPGSAWPLGAARVPGGVHYSVYSHGASACALVLFLDGGQTAQIPFSRDCRTGDVFHMTVWDQRAADCAYGYRFWGEGPWFNEKHVLLDPYAKGIRGRERWGQTPDAPLLSYIPKDTFDWRGDTRPPIPLHARVIYEAHVRGMTVHESAGVRHPGTFEGLVQKIPYLKRLGVNVLLLLPVFEYDEFEGSRLAPDGRTLLMNYWGYSPVSLFAVKAGLAAQDAGEAFQKLVRQMHRHGILVYLDFSVNHTMEGNERGKTLSLRGIDNDTYYRMTPEGLYDNASGCGNTLNFDHPVTQHWFLDALRHFAGTYKVDGFRVLQQSVAGIDLSRDPVLNGVTFITRMDHHYRDALRGFLKGDEGLAGTVAADPDGLRYITCHDGFTLFDLHAFSQKRNGMNGHDNRDGEDTPGWDCVLPGATRAQTQALRLQMMKNALTALLLGRGTPLLTAGDELARSQGGNSNAYCQDNDISHMDWTYLQKNAELFTYTRRLIALRRQYAGVFDTAPRGYSRHGFPPVSSHGLAAFAPAPWSRTLGMLYCNDGHFVYVIFNMHWLDQTFALPVLPEDRAWQLVCQSAPGMFSDGRYEAAARSSAVFTAAVP